MYVGARGTASWTLEKCKWNAAAILVGHQNIGRELHLMLAHSTFPFAAICDRAYLLYGVFAAAFNVYTYRRTCAKFWELIRRGNNLLNQLAVFDFEQDRKIWPSKWWLRLFRTVNPGNILLLLLCESFSSPTTFSRDVVRNHYEYFVRTTTEICIRSEVEAVAHFSEHVCRSMCSEPGIS